MRRFVWFEDLDGLIVCPKCTQRIDDIANEQPIKDADGNIVFDFQTFQPEYCPFCGQHLDWSKTIPYGVKEEHD